MYVLCKQIQFTVITIFLQNTSRAICRAVSVMQAQIVRYLLNNNNVDKSVTTRTLHRRSDIERCERQRRRLYTSSDEDEAVVGTGLTTLNDSGSSSGMSSRAHHNSTFSSDNTTNKKEKLKR